MTRLGAIAVSLAAMLLGASLAPAAIAQQNESPSERVSAEDVPESVAAQVQCGTDPHDVTRRRFAGGYVFAWECASNNANWIMALIYADDTDGANARLLRFPGPPGSAAAEELSNVRWYPAAREVTGLFVNPEETICRTEARWRLAGHPPDARLIFWRETRDSDGKRGWRIVVDPRRK